MYCRRFPPTLLLFLQYPVVRFCQAVVLPFVRRQVQVLVSWLILWWALNHCSCWFRPKTKDQNPNLLCKTNSLNLSFPSHSQIYRAFQNLSADLAHLWSGLSVSRTWSASPKVVGAWKLFAATSTAGILSSLSLYLLFSAGAGQRFRDWSEYQSLPLWIICQAQEYQVLTWRREQLQG